MLKEEILEKLVCFTDEEIDNLNGKNIIDKSIYETDISNIVDSEKLLFNNQQISVRKHTRFCKYPVHKHNYVEFIFVCSGKMINYINGRKIVLHEGDIMLLNQNVEHSIDFCDENDIIFNFIIKPDFLRFLSSLLEEKNKLCQFILDTLYSNNDVTEYMIFRTRENIKIKNNIESIITCIYEPTLNSYAELRLRFGLLLTELMNYPEQIELFCGDIYENTLMNSIMMYIKSNYQYGTLEDLSSQLHLPDYRICKVIKKITGSTFKQLIQEERLNVAVTLLKTTNLPISRIMEDIGYENETYFYRLFKSKYKVTPNRYRNNKQGRL